MKQYYDVLVSIKTVTKSMKADDMFSVMSVCHSVHIGVHMLTVPGPVQTCLLGDTSPTPVPAQVLPHTLRPPGPTHPLDLFKFVHL